MLRGTDRANGQRIGISVPSVTPQAYNDTEGVRVSTSVVARMVLGASVTL